MAVTQLEICNNALSLCGQGTHITSLTEESKEADSCARLFTRCVERCVDKYDWSFARKDEVITTSYLLQDVASPPFAYTYNLPSDCLRIVSLAEAIKDTWYARQLNGRRTIPFDYRNYNGKKVFVTDVEAPFVVQYQALVTDVTLFPPTVVEALEYIMAGALALDLVKGTTGTQIGLEMEKQGYTLLKQAYSLDTHIGVEPIQDQTVSSFMQSRRNYRNFYNDY